MPEKGPRVLIAKGPFELWTYERHLITKGIPFLALVMILVLIEAFVLQGPSIKVMGWMLAILFVSPFMMYAFGSSIDIGWKRVGWSCPWHATAWLRRWFRTQYCIVYVILALFSLYSGSMFLAVGFMAFMVVFMAMSWAFESRLWVTSKGVATRIGVLTWDAISEITFYPKDGIMVLRVSGAMRFYMPFIIYWVPAPAKVERAIRAVLKTRT